MAFRAWLTLALAGILSLARAHEVPAEMAGAARRFLEALTPEQRAQAALPFDHAARTAWQFVPAERRGVKWGDLSDPQQAAATRLLRSGLSAHGHATVAQLMSLELVLREIEGPASAARRDPGRYWLTVFGQPDPVAPWGWRCEGHHVSVNFTLAGGRISATPNFLGANPAEVMSGPRAGTRVLAEVEDLARGLVQSLTVTQRARAVLSADAPRDILTGNARRVDPLHPAGVAASDLDPAQRARLQSLVAAYVNRVRPELARDDLAAIAAAGWGRVTFAWAGGFQRGEPHYYRVQGPTFLLEYDNSQNQANHVHSVWRTFEGDFGDDLLRDHYAREPHDG